MIFELTRTLHLNDYKGIISITPIARWISVDSHIDTLYAFAKKVVCYKKPYPLVNEVQENIISFIPANNEDADLFHS